MLEDSNAPVFVHISGYVAGENCIVQFFHNSGKLSDIKCYTYAPAQLATNFVIHTGKGTVQKTVAKFNIVDHFKEPGNAHKRINLFAIEQAGNLDFVIAVDFAGCVF